MKIDSILNAAFKANCADIVLRSDCPPIGEDADKRDLIPGNEEPLTAAEVSEILDELLAHKKLRLTPLGLTFPYTDLEHSDYRVSVLTPDCISFKRVSKIV